MEDTIKIFIYIHALFGGIGLITGIGSILVKKGSSLHKKMGTLFSIGMLTSSIISMPIACLPNHKNSFLFLIGLFTIYLVVSGNLALRFKTKKKAHYKDILTSGGMMLCCLIMIILGINGAIHSSSTSVLYFVFGGIGLFLTCKDFKFYKAITTKKNTWMVLHIGKMNGALIASVTAFFVAGLGLDNLVIWMLPTVIGTMYIIYWSRKTTAIRS